MCRIEAHIHVHCGCLYHINIFSQCPGFKRKPDTGVPYCSLTQNAGTTKVPAEGPSCCSSCYPAKRRDLQNKFQKNEEKIIDKYKYNKHTQKQLDDQLIRNKTEYQERRDLLKRPYQRTLRDAMAYGRLGIRDGGNGW